jgi:hypothetical protein
VASGFLRASFGNLRLWVSSMSSSIGRTQVVQTPARGDSHGLDDRGRELERTQCEIVFCQIPSEPDHHLDRYATFKEMVAEGKPQVFTHPLHGSYRAVIGDCQVVAEGADRVVVQVDFLQLEPPIEVFEVATGATALAGPEATATAAAAADSALAEADLESDVPGEASAMVEGWEDSEAPAATVYAEAGASIRAIDDLIESLQLATDLTRWPAYRAMVQLRARVRDAAAAAAQTSASLMEFVVEVPTPLRVILATVYGADADIEDLTRQVRELNGIRVPGLVPAGVTLKLPSLEVAL